MSSEPTTPLTDLVVRPDAPPAPAPDVIDIDEPMTPRQRRQTVEHQERMQQALTLRKEGLDYNDIAREMGVSRREAGALVLEGLFRHDEEVREMAHAVRALETERLDMLWRATWDAVKQPHFTPSGELVLMPDGTPAEITDLAAVDRCLKIMERRAKLLGLDSPVKVQAEITKAEFTHAVIEHRHRLEGTEASELHRRYREALEESREG